MPRFAHRVALGAAWTIVSALALPPVPPAFALTGAARVASLARAASDPGLAEWQRGFYRERLDEALAPPAPAHDEIATPLAATDTPPIWSVLADTPRRQGQSLVLDATTGRLFAFGGRNGTDVFNTVFVLEPDGAREWHALAVSGSAPPARLAHAAVIDPVNRRMLVYGGADADGSYLADLWALNLDGPPVWTSLSPAGDAPWARANHFAVVDTAHARMIVFGGGNGGFSPLADLWALSLDASPAWTPLHPGNAFPASFAPQAMLVDEGRQRLVFPGLQTVNYSPSWVLATLSLMVPTPNWTVQATPYTNGPSAYPSVPPTFSIDATGDRLVCVQADYYSYTYALALGGSPSQWTQVLGMGATPPFRYGRASALDAPNRRLYFAGGGPGSYSSVRFSSDLASLDLVGLSAWTNVAGDPPPRGGHSLALDPARGVLHLFGGACDSTGSGYGSILTNTLWRLSLGSASPAWSPEISGGGPLLPRRDASLVVDPVRDRLLLFGGADGTAMTNELWQRPLSGDGTWYPLAIGGILPRQRANAAAAYDPEGDRLLVFGGYDYSSGTGFYLADLWSLSLGATPQWTKLEPAGERPAGRMDGALVLDPVRQCAYLVGGRSTSLNDYYGGSVRPDEVWRLSLSPGPSWTRLAAGTPANYAYPVVTGACFYDASQGAIVRVYNYGGYISSGETRVARLHPTGDTSWTAVPFGGMPPPASSDARGAFDPQLRRIAWFGGAAYGNEGTWALSFGEAPLDVPPGSTGAVAAFRIAPNPARGACTARFALARPGRVSLELHDLSGRRVRGPVAADLPAGPGELRLADLLALPAGVYFARLSGALERRARVAVVH
ncbi:MAG: hypothetical protein IT347_05315 [Candidatus Eisenbacteria bacterium]|nr:hypothetical protein [Candidatus Eisenbacteria bacterium]